MEMPDDHTTDDIVHESALQLWAAAQTDFDPFEVPPEEWGPNVVPVRFTKPDSSTLRVIVPREGGEVGAVIVPR